MQHFPKRLTIQWIKSGYANNQLTPKELIEEIIKRANVHQEKNIWITKPSMEFIDKYIKALPKDREDYPLWGIPFAIKDNIDLEHIETTAACPDFAYLPKENAFVVDQLIKAGGIPVGKTNLDQFATGLVGTRSPYGEVHNSQEDELISGGSSSGSAVSVALGMAAFSLGTDTAGSGRVPASLNTLIGYKPPLGAWSTRGVVPACASLDCVTVFANELEDIHIVDHVVRKLDEQCCWSKEFQNQMVKLPEKILIPKDAPEFYGQWAEIYHQKWKQALERIQKLGLSVQPIDITMFQNAAAILYDGAWVAERWKDLKDFVETHPGKIFPVTEHILRSGGSKEKTAEKLFENIHQLQEYRYQTKKLLQNAVLLLPTAGGTFTRKEVRENPVETNSLMGRYTNHCNLLDLSAIAVPENTRDEEYPFGITLFALANAQNLILGTAEKFLSNETGSC